MQGCSLAGWAQDQNGAAHGEFQAEACVQLGGNLSVDFESILRRQRVLPEVAQVAAARDDVRVVDRFEQHGDA